MESVRCMSARLYWSVGGHDQDLVLNEDKDLDLRVRSAGTLVGRTSNFVLHHEGQLSLWNALRKDAQYGRTAIAFGKKHPQHLWGHTQPFARYLLFLSRPKMLLKHPLLALGLFVMKSLEYCAGVVGMVTAA